MTIQVKDAVTGTAQTVKIPDEVASTIVAPIGAQGDAAYTDATGAAAGGLVGLLKGSFVTLKAILTGVNAATPAGTNKIGGVTVADGDMATMGSKADAAYADATGAAAGSNIGLLKGLFVALKAGLGLTAGEAHIGKVGGETASNILASFTRPANTTAYASGQLVANNTAAASVVPMSLSAARIAGGTGSIRRVRLRSSRIGSGTEVYRVHLFKGPSAGNAPVVTVGDGGVFAAGVPVVGAIHMGSFDVTLDILGSDGMKGTAAPRNGGEVNFDTWAGQTNIYALIEARGAVTPASGETFELALEVLRD